MLDIMVFSPRQKAPLLFQLSKTTFIFLYTHPKNDLLSGNIQWGSD